MINHIFLSPIKGGAGNRGRTGTSKSSRDFWSRMQVMTLLRYWLSSKSRASAYSAIPAYSDCAKHNHFVVCTYYSTNISICQGVFVIVYILFTNGYISYYPRKQLHCNIVLTITINMSPFHAIECT